MQVDDVEGQLADLDGVAMGEDPVGLDRQRLGVELMRCGRCAGGLGHLFERLHMIEVLVAGDDQGQLRREPFDEFEQDLGVVGRVDE